MPHKKSHSPFDISNMFPRNNDNFGFKINSSFVDQSYAKQRKKSAKTKKFVDERYRAIQSRSVEPLSPAEEAYGESGLNIYGQRKI